ncbi:MAG TPA: SxtJ family membrane protein [Longimicrobiaceae bacterium]|nr:SxtJ family membrane protein [Longimicrobiaceae bacterium]
MAASKAQFHEDLSREEEVKGPSERSFGIVFTTVFAVLGVWPLLHGRGVRTWTLGVAAAFLVLTLARPALLAPLNRLWFRFGLLLHRIVSPIVLGMLFFLTVTPVGYLMRLFGKRPLQLGFDPKVDSYWILRQPTEPAPETMTRQF